MTPPEEPTPLIGVPCGGGINPSSLCGGSSMGINQQSLDSPHTTIQIGNTDSPQQQQQQSNAPPSHHLQGTIV